MNEAHRVNEAHCVNEAHRVDEAHRPHPRRHLFELLPQLTARISQRSMPFRRRSRRAYPRCLTQRRVQEEGRRGLSTTPPDTARDSTERHRRAGRRAHGRPHGRWPGACRRDSSLMPSSLGVPPEASPGVRRAKRYRGCGWPGGDICASSSCWHRGPTTSPCSVHKYTRGRAKSTETGPPPSLIRSSRSGRLARRRRDARRRQRPTR